MSKAFKIIYLNLMFLLWINVSAQVEINGLVDFEVSQGGKDSNFGLNEIASEYKDPHLAINQLNLFLFSQSQFIEEPSSDKLIKYSIIFKIEVGKETLFGSKPG